MATQEEKEQFAKGAKSSGVFTSTTPFGRFMNRVFKDDRKKKRKKKETAGRDRRR